MEHHNKAIFLGSKQLGLKGLETLVRVIPNSMVGVVTIDDSTDNRSVLNTFQEYCSKVNLPLSIIKKPSELNRIVSSYKPDIVFVLGWYWIIPSTLLASVPTGFVGVHASLLPKYRGNAPLVWAILKGEEQSGVTLFYFDDGIDTGDIVSQSTFIINFNDTIANALSKTEEAIIDLLSSYAGQLVNGTAPRRKQEHSQATYVSLRRPEDGEIRWHHSAENLYNFIRAQTRPYPGAFTYLSNGKIMRIWAASLFPFPYYGIPGLVGQKYGDGVVVACGDGALVIKEFEVEGNNSDSVLKWGRRLG